MADSPISSDVTLTAAQIAVGDLVPLVDISEAAAADKNKNTTFTHLTTYFQTNLLHDSFSDYVADEHIDWSVTGAEDIHVDRIAAGAVTQHVGSIDHDQLLNFEASEHFTKASILLDDLGDVTETTITTGDLLRWNGSAWVNYADSNYAASGHNHDSDYISIVSTPTTGNFPQLTAGGELVNSTYDETSFEVAGAVAAHDGGNAHIDWTSGLVAGFNSLGIDDNATTEVFDLAVGNNALTMGTSGEVWSMRRDVNDQSVYLSGGTNSATGAVLKLYGGAHASAANDIYLYADGADKLVYDNTDDTWEFKVVAEFTEIKSTAADSGIIFGQGAATATEGSMDCRTNFHIDAPTTGIIYLNWYSGTGGVWIGDGAAGKGSIFSNQCLVDTSVHTPVIAERTGGTGVTIDSFLIKDGNLKPANAKGMISNVDDGSMILSAGTSSNLGANLHMYGSTTTGFASDFLFRANTTAILQYDHTSTRWESKVRFVCETDFQTDVIDEFTPATGVTIDGVLIKDGLVDGVDVSALGAGANSFTTHTVTATDSGYTWADTGSVVADSTTDTLTWVEGLGIDMDVDATLDAVRITIEPAQTNIATIYNTGAKWGYNSSNHIDFTATAQCDFVFDSVIDFQMQDGGDFHAEGNVYAYSASISSDRKLKKDFAPIDRPIERIKAMNGCTYTLRKDEQRKAGLIAQDVQEVLPEAVAEAPFLNEEGTYLTLDYNAVIGTLVEAVKELTARVEELEK